MSYRVCIPCAGTGSRLGKLTKTINKSLVGVDNKPMLSHIISYFPSDVEFVIPLGYKGELVKEFLYLAYPNHNFIFAKINPYEGYGSGLGVSIMGCKNYLQDPFVFIACDTLIEGKIQAPTTNWLGYAKVSESRNYRTIDVEGTFVREIYEKDVKDSTNNAYIGLCGVYDYGEFWTSLEAGGEESRISGEAYALKGLIPKGIQAYVFNWDDAGNPKGLELARKKYAKPDNPEILEKENEAIWFVYGNVIKFSDDSTFIENRAKRAKLIQNYIPRIIAKTEHMYMYRMIRGEVFSKVINIPLFMKLLEVCDSFWLKQDLKGVELESFNKRCMVFYKDKTYRRVKDFYSRFNLSDQINCINGKYIPKLETLLEQIDWDWLVKGIPGRFHGDFHFENIIWDKDSERFVFIDWRQDFGGNLEIGDIYYDLAKMMHGIIISHSMINSNFFSVQWCDERITFDLHRSHILVECEREYIKWLLNKGYDVKKVGILTALVFINIAVLHHNPYSLLLYALGKSKLFEELGY